MNSLLTTRAAKDFKIDRPKREDSKDFRTLLHETSRANKLSTFFKPKHASHCGTSGSEVSFEKISKFMNCNIVKFISDN